MSPYFAIAQYGLLSPYFAIAQYALLSPYFAIAQYGLWVALLPAAIRALCRPIACGNTGSGSGYVLVSLRAYAYAFLPGVALRYTPGCILAPLQGALDPNRALRAPTKYVGTFPGR